MADERIPMTQACKRLGMSWPRVWNLVLTGRIDGEKFDGRWMLSARDVERIRAERAELVAATA